MYTNGLITREIRHVNGVNATNLSKLLKMLNPPPPQTTTSMNFKKSTNNKMTTLRTSTTRAPIMITFYEFNDEPTQSRFRGQTPSTKFDYLLRMSSREYESLADMNNVLSDRDACCCSKGCRFCGATGSTYLLGPQPMDVNLTPEVCLDYLYRAYRGWENESSPIFHEIMDCPIFYHMVPDLYDFMFDYDYPGMLDKALWLDIYFFDPDDSSLLMYSPWGARIYQLQGGTVDMEVDIDHDLVEYLNKYLNEYLDTIPDGKIVKQGLGVELNTSGLLKGIREIFHDVQEAIPADGIKGNVRLDLSDTTTSAVTELQNAISALSKSVQGGTSVKVDFKDSIDAILSGVGKATKNMKEIKHEVKFGFSFDYKEILLKILAVVAGCYSVYKQDAFSVSVATALVAVAFGGELVDKFQDFVSKIRKQGWSEGVQALLFSALITDLCSKLGKTDSSLIHDFATKAAHVPRQIVGISTISDLVLGLLQKAIDAVYKMVTGKECPHNFFGKSTSGIYKVISEIENVESSRNANEIEPKECLTYMLKLRNELLACVKDEGPASFATRMAQPYINNLNKVIVEIESFLKANAGYRVQPVGLCLMGSAGIGKSWLSSIFSEFFAMHLSSKFMVNQFKIDPESIGRMIYLYNPADNYMSGYTGQCVFYIDEATDEVPVTGTAPLPDLLIRLINSTPLSLNMADLSSKGNTFFTSKIVLATTNKRVWSGFKGVSDEAVYRRIKYVSVVVKDQEYASNCVNRSQEEWRINELAKKKMQAACDRFHNKNLTLDQFIDECYSHLEFKVIDMSKAQGNGSHTSVGEIMSPSSLLHMMVEQYKAHQGDFQLRSGVTTTMVESILSECIDEVPSLFSNRKKTNIVAQGGHEDDKPTIDELVRKVKGPSGLPLAKMTATNSDEGCLCGSFTEYLEIYCKYFNVPQDSMMGWVKRLEKKERVCAVCPLCLDLDMDSMEGAVEHLAFLKHRKYEFEGDCKMVIPPLVCDSPVVPTCLREFDLYYDSLFLAENGFRLSRNRAVMSSDLCAYIMFIVKNNSSVEANNMLRRMTWLVEWNKGSYTLDKGSESAYAQEVAALMEGDKLLKPIVTKQGDVVPVYYDEWCKWSEALKSKEKPPQTEEEKKQFEDLHRRIMAEPIRGRLGWLGTIMVAPIGWMAKLKQLCDDPCYGNVVGTLVKLTGFISAATVVYALFRKGADKQGQYEKTYKATKAKLQRNLINRQGGGNQIYDMLSSVMASNVWSYSVRHKPDSSRREIGHLIMVQNHVALMPHHLLEAWLDIYVANSEAVVKLKRLADVKGEAEIPLSNIFEFDEFDGMMKVKGGAYSVGSKFETAKGFCETDTVMFRINLPGRSIVDKFMKAEDFKKSSTKLGSEAYVGIPGHNTFGRFATGSCRYVGHWRDVCTGPNENHVPDDDPEYDPNLDERHWFSDKILHYKANTQMGDCGSPAVTLVNGMPAIVSIHVAGDQYGNGYGVMVFKEDVQECLDALATNAIGTHDQISLQVDGPPTLMHEITAHGGSPYVGHNTLMRVTKPHLPQQTKLRKSKLYEVFVKEVPRVAPAALKPFFDAEGVHIDPMKVAVSGYGLGGVQPPQHELDYVANTLYSNMVRAVQPLPYEKVLPSWEEVIQPGPGWPMLQSMPRKTSPGYPYCLHSKNGKKKYFGSGEDYDFSSPEYMDLIKEVEWMESEMKKGNRPLNVCMSFLKDERRPLDRVRAGKTRLISASNVAFSMITRKYTMGFLHFLVRGRLQNGVAVGVNPYSEEWSILARLHGESNGDSLNASVAGDFSGFDKGMVPSFIQTFGDLMDKFYGVGDEATIVRRVIIEELAYSLHVVEDRVIEWFGSNPSGNALTAHLNSVVDLLQIMFVITKRYCIETKSNFNQKIVNKLFGGDTPYFRKTAFGDDQLITRLSKLACLAWFGQEQMTQDFKKFLGLTYTNESKGKDAFKDLRSLKECTFLKRGFSYACQVPGQRHRCLSPLDFDTIRTSIMWKKSGDINGSDWKDNVRNMLIEASAHPDDKFYDFFGKIKAGFEDDEASFYEITEGRTKKVEWQEELLQRDERL